MGRFAGGDGDGGVGCQKRRRNGYQEPLHRIFSVTVFAKVGLDVVHMPPATNGAKYMVGMLDDFRALAEYKGPSSVHSGACGAPNFPVPHGKFLPATAPRGGAGRGTKSTEWGGAGRLFGPPGHFPVPGPRLLTGPRPVYGVFLTVSTVLFSSRARIFYCRYGFLHHM